MKHKKWQKYKYLSLKEIVVYLQLKNKYLYYLPIYCFTILDIIFRWGTNISSKVTSSSNAPLRYLLCIGNPMKNQFKARDLMPTQLQCRRVEAEPLVSFDIIALFTNILYSDAKKNCSKLLTRAALKSWKNAICGSRSFEKFQAKNLVKWINFLTVKFWFLWNWFSYLISRLFLP